MKNWNWNKAKAIYLGMLGAFGAFGSVGALALIFLGWLIWMIMKHSDIGLIEILIALIVITGITLGGFVLYERDQKKKGKWDVRI